MSEPSGSGSLADRISQPVPLNPASSSFTPTGGNTSWADEVASPSGEKSEEHKSLDAAQSDGATQPMGGSSLHDTEYDVEVKLSDIQAQEGDPLYSISSFEELGM